MKKFALALLLMQAPFIFGEKPSSNPADYPITVHVVVSRFIPGTKEEAYHQQLEVIIDGQRMELRSEGGSGLGVLALGDYKAQLSNTGFVPKHPNGYDTFVTYRFLLPQGVIRDFDVTGLWSKADTDAPSTHP
jgi:hypothetical protein